MTGMRLLWMLVAVVASCAHCLQIQNLLKIARFYDTAHSHIVFMPEQKLAFCWMQKVASQHFNALFNAVNDNTGGFENKYEAVRYWELGLNLSEVTRENGWSFATFVRDPLERYLSAFLSKCVPRDFNEEIDLGGRFCHGPMRSGPLTVEDKIAVFEAHVKNHTASGLPEDTHWLSQTTILRDYCGMDRFNLAHLDFLGKMAYDVDNVNSQVQAMLSLTSLANVAQLAGKHFPVSKGASLLGCPTEHCTKSHEDFEQFYRNEETVRQVQHLFQDDYDTFNFTKLVQ